MVSGSEIREKLAEYLENRIDADQLEDWILQYSWNAHKAGLPPSVQRLVYTLDALFARYNSNGMDEGALRRVLIGILNDYFVTVSFEPSSKAPEMQTGADYDVKFQSALIRSFDIRPATVSA